MGVHERENPSTRNVSSVHSPPVFRCISKRGGVQKTQSAGLRAGSSLGPPELPCSSRPSHTEGPGSAQAPPGPSSYTLPRCLRSVLSSAWQVPPHWLPWPRVRAVLTATAPRATACPPPSPQPLLKDTLSPPILPHGEQSRGGLRLGQARSGTGTCDARPSDSPSDAGGVRDGKRGRVRWLVRRLPGERAEDSGIHQLRSAAELMAAILTPRPPPCPHRAPRIPPNPPPP